MAAVMALGGLQLAEVGHRNQLAQEQLCVVENSRDPCIGAAAMARGTGEMQAESPPRMVPEPALAKDDLRRLQGRMLVPRAFTDRPVHVRERKTKVALVGNSHAAQWLPALQVLAKKNGWTLSTYLITRCNLTSVPLDFNNPERTRNCLAYGRWVIGADRRTEVEVVITSARQSVTVDGESWKTTEQPPSRATRPICPNGRRPGPRS